MARVVGVDLGGTKIAAAVVDEQGRATARRREPVRKQDTPRQLAELAAESVAAAGLSWKDVSGVGVCVPGVYFSASGNAWAPNLWGREEFPLRSELEARLPVPVSIDSDRVACVLGEQWKGAARGLTDVVFLAVGTGIGAGILIDGRVCRGSAGVAGAVGWFALDPRHKRMYREVGCFEAEAAGPSLARRAAGRIAAGDESVLRSENPIAAEAVAAAARHGDALARRVFGETASWLAMGVANLVSALNPQMVVLGGGLMQAGDLLLDAVRNEMLDWAQPLAAGQVRVELSSLGEDAGLLGAARLALLPD